MVEKNLVSKFQIVRISNGIGNLEAKPIEIQTNDHHLVENHFKFVHFCKDFELSSFQMAETTAVVGFQIPIVHRCFIFFQVSRLFQIFRTVSLPLVFLRLGPAIFANAAFVFKSLRYQPPRLRHRRS